MYKSTSGQRTFHYWAVAAWNSLFEELKSVKKKQLMALLFDDLSLYTQFYKF